MNETGAPTPELIPMTMSTTILVPPPPSDLPYEDDVPMESLWHRVCMNLLIDIVETWFQSRGRKDFFVGGNMFVYFSPDQKRTHNYTGPDFFFVHGPNVEHDKPRKYWAAWDEHGQHPHVIIELLSPSTAQFDRENKKEIYERTMRIPEYFLYDTATETLEGWRLNGGGYAAVEPDERGWLWSKQLKLWLGTWKGSYQGQNTTWLRFFGESGQLAPTSEESAEGRAAEERKRAEVAEAEVDRLRRELEELRRRAKPE